MARPPSNDRLVEFCNHIQIEYVRDSPQMTRWSLLSYIRETEVIQEGGASRTTVDEVLAPDAFTYLGDMVVIEEVVASSTTTDVLAPIAFTSTGETEVIQEGGASRTHASVAHTSAGDMGASRTTTDVVAHAAFTSTGETEVIQEGGASRTHASVALTSAGETPSLERNHQTLYPQLPGAANTSTSNSPQQQPQNAENVSNVASRRRDGNKKRSASTSKRVKVDPSPQTRNLPPPPPASMVDGGRYSNWGFGLYPPPPPPIAGYYNPHAQMHYPPDTSGMWRILSENQASLNELKRSVEEIHGMLQKIMGKSETPQK